uniref:M-phase phosphoprotein 6-like n=1 Tax=Phallusia mammillata TaxID=59560 RepID=A0A6F9DKG3_9ASCI|nr:M-phase phosphoprotein 6-like [Phallusia mammillata]
MTQEKPTPSKLSLNLRKMKFMQRGMSESERHSLEEANSKIITNEHWELDLPPMGKNDSSYEQLDGISLCVKLKHGRMSFGGFNKAIEKLMYELNREEKTEDDATADSDASVSDEEMAERYSTLIGTVAKKFKSKNTTDNDFERKGRKLDNDVNETEVPAKVKRTNKRFLKPSE